MAERTKRWPWLLLLFGGTVAASYLAGQNSRETKTVPPPLPAATIVTKIVEKLVPVDVPILNPVNVGALQDRDRANRKAQRLQAEVFRLTEKLEIVSIEHVLTEPEVKEAEAVIEKAADLGQLLGRVRFQADRFEGLDTDGIFSYGWTGQAQCEIRAEDADPWLQIVSQPFDLDGSRSFATEGPKEPGPVRWSQVRLGLTTAPGFDLSYARHRKRFGWYAGMQYDTSPESFTSFDFSNEFSRTISADTLRLYGGVALTLGRK